MAEPQLVSGLRALRKLTRCSTSQALALRAARSAVGTRGFATGTDPRPVLSYACGTSTKPLVGHTIGHAFDLAVAAHCDRLALACPEQGVEWTFAELSERVDKLASAMLRLGLQRGDRVAIWSPNNAEYSTFLLAAAYAGLVGVVINPAYKSKEAQYAFSLVGCKALLMAQRHSKSDYVAALREICPEVDTARPGQLRSAGVPTLQHVVTFGEERLGGAFMRYNDLLASATPGDVAAMRAQEARLDCDDIVGIQYSSGTTGKPKAIALSHHNTLNNALIVSHAMRMTERDVVCNMSPLFHCLGQVLGFLGPLAHGSAQLLPCAGFDAAKTLRAAAKYGATALIGTPTMFINLLESPLLDEVKPALKCTMRTGIMAGALCPAALMRHSSEELGTSQLVICYGMTETSPVSLMTTPDDSEEKRTTTVGKVVAHTEVKIVDAEGNIVPRGQRGELCSRGYLLARGGYFGNPQATAEAVVNGWMHTGDVAEMDAQGYVTITGRIKDMIARGGEKIFPKELEDALLAHPAVVDASVFGVSHDKMGEEVAVNVILRAAGYHGAPAQPVTLEQLKEWLRPQVAHYKLPKYWRAVDSFPKTASGKIQKFVMRAELEAELNAGMR